MLSGIWWWGRFASVPSTRSRTLLTERANQDCWRRRDFWNSTDYLLSLNEVQWRQWLPQLSHEWRGYESPMFTVLWSSTVTRSPEGIVRDLQCGVLWKKGGYPSTNEAAPRANSSQLLIVRWSYQKNREWTDKQNTVAEAADHQYDKLL